jgi:RNA polymerase primary sigma factor
MEDESSEVPDSGLMATSLQQEVQNALSTLTERESQVISLYYGLSGGHSISLEEIAEQFDLTRERVRQIKEKATKKLMHPSRRAKLKAYLG